MGTRRLFFVYFVFVMLVFYGCADFSRTYKPENYKLKTQALANLPLQVEIDSLSLLNAFSVCEYQHGTARKTPGIDTTYVSGFVIQDKKICFIKEAITWTTASVSSVPGNAYMAGVTTVKTYDHYIPGGKMALGNPRTHGTSLLSIVADPEVPKNVVFQGTPSYFYPESDKRLPISIEKFTQYRIKHSNSWFYFKRGTTNADVDSMNLSLFLNPVNYADVVTKSKLFGQKKEGSAVLLYTSPIHEIYDPAVIIVNKQIRENPVFYKRNPKGKVVITFTGTTQFHFPPGIFLTIPPIVTFCTLPLLGIPYMSYTAEIPIKASVYDSTGKLIKEYYSAGKKTGYSAYYWGYHYNVIRQQTMAPTGGMFGQPVFRDAYSKALVDAIDNILQEVINDKQTIESEL